MQRHPSGLATAEPDAPEVAAGTGLPVLQAATGIHTSDGYGYGDGDGYGYGDGDGYGDG